MNFSGPGRVRRRRVVCAIEQTPTFAARYNIVLHNSD